MCGDPGPKGPSTSYKATVRDIRDGIDVSLIYGVNWLIKYFEYFSNNELKQHLPPQQRIMLEKIYNILCSPKKVADLRACLSEPKIWDLVYAGAEQKERLLPSFSPLEGPR